MKLFAASAVVLALFGALFGGGQLTRTDVEHALRAQMNGGSAGQITRRVHCSELGHATRAGGTTYACTLTSMHGSRQHAIVTASNGSWRAAWAPLKG
jgi:hypothetical protein